MAVKDDAVVEENASGPIPINSEHTQLSFARSPTGIRFCTLNCWGLKFVSKQREARIAAIAAELKDTVDQYDIVSLQEVWVESDFHLLQQAVAHELPHTKRWYSGILAGPGLVVFSRWPIRSSWLYRFPLNGRPSAFFRGDWFVGKSAGSCTIEHPLGCHFEVVVAHLHAPYAASGDAAYECHRAAQAWDLSQLVQRMTSHGRATFVVGDLNAKPGSVNYRLFEDIAELSDAWVAVHSDAYADRMGSLTPIEQVELAGVTCDSQLNTWRDHYPRDKAKRLDYVLFDSRTAQAHACHVVFTKQIPGVGSMSDHFGVAVAFNLTEAQMSLESRSLENKASVIDDTLGLIDAYWPTNRWQAQWRLAHFFASLAGLVGLLVGVWWGAAHNRAYVGFIFIIAAVVISVTGVVNGLIGFLFGRNEHRALTEFHNQVLMAKRGLS